MDLQECTLELVHSTIELVDSNIDLSRDYYITGGETIKTQSTPQPSPRELYHTLNNEKMMVYKDRLVIYKCLCRTLSFPGASLSRRERERCDQRF
jgi:hypothetical protein